MERVEDPASLLTWLADRPDEQAFTGYDAAGGDSSAWVLALLGTLGRHSVDGPRTDCVAFYASLPAGDFDTLHVWRVPLSAIPGLLEDRGGPYAFSPTNLWPVDRSWLVWTDYDLLGTKVSGSDLPVEAIKSHPALETADWPGDPR